MVNSSTGTGDRAANEPLPEPADTNPAVPPRRVVILGASNVIRNISTVITTAEHFRGQPLDFLAATGHGRSYGLTSRILGRSLPAIRTCALWDALAERPRIPTVSLVTDIGNDLLYGASVETIVSWVDQCLTKLAGISDRLILTELPLENIARLNFYKFFLIRSILFPNSRLTLTAAREMAAALNDRIANLASAYGATLIKPDVGWYGADPIHIHRRHSDNAWQQIMLPWKTDAATRVDPPLSAKRIPSSRCRPYVRWVMGIEQRRAQPTLRLPSGTQVSFF